MNRWIKFFKELEAHEIFTLVFGIMSFLCVLASIFYDCAINGVG